MGTCVTGAVTTTTMTTTYTVVLSHAGESTRIEADTYRTPDHPERKLRELYFYMDDADEPLATFPSGSWQGVFESDSGRYSPG